MTRPTSIKLDDDLKGRIQQLADARQRSAHWLMREAIEQYVKREERREALRQDALNAWEDYQATGLHATADEVEQWLVSWGKDDEVPAPSCHK
ncbi:putative transcriptional regulator [Halomonas campaniensis]|uniref:Putative transcriptional regulator n=1 Tax=Halomonas campaniensis TaxID=213554 RepID=A0A7W5K5W9_9GAMM|nr:CopG family ribbon-helix-helix protein [Halomonas campaniensis]MBB3332471.1 putative transcriptional regulator [Halomonas campaniensis]